MNSVVKSQFTCSPLILVLCSILNSSLNHIHDRPLHLVPQYFIKGMKLLLMRNTLQPQKLLVSVFRKQKNRQFLSQTYYMQGITFKGKIKNWNGDMF